MKKPESYWTYQAGDIPEFYDLPAGTFNGTREEWEKLSPGFRREIYRQATRQKAAPQMTAKRGPNDREDGGPKWQNTH